LQNNNLFLRTSYEDEIDLETIQNINERKGILT